MTPRRIVSAKISRPGLSSAVKRERLFKLLDERMNRPVVWVFSPAGSGKSTLVSSYLDSRKLPCLWYQCDEGDSDPATFFYYMSLAAKKAVPRSRISLPLLTPEYRTAIPVFARRYFEGLYDRLLGPGLSAPSKRRFCVVLDNYQDVPSSSPFHHMISVGLDMIPDEVRLIVVSRGGPPSTFARMQANGRIGIVDYGDLRFTLEESKGLVQGRVPTLSNERIAVIHKKTEGWAAGMVLLLERARIEETATPSGSEVDYDRVFDYFAGEILGRTEKGVRDFLLKTAFLPVLTVPLAARLTGTTAAKEILSTLNNHRYFTEKLSGDGQIYQYHPLFRAFLVDTAKATLLSDEVTTIQRKAALLSEQSGNIEEAGRLYSDVGDTDGLTRIVIRHGQELVAQGRSRVVEEWIGAIPHDLVDGNPWLLYWSGMCSFPVDLARTKERLRKAFESFTGIDDGTGICLSWAGIVDAYAYGLDDWGRLDEWITRFNGLTAAHFTPSTDELDLIVSSRMLMALALRKTDQTRSVAAWYERLSALLRKNPSVAIRMETMFCMSLYYLWIGEYSKNAVLLEGAEAEIRRRPPSPFANIRVKMMKGIHCWVTAQYDAALQALSGGLDIAETSGIHVFDSLLWSFRAAAEIASGRMEAARVSVRNQHASSLEGAATLETFFYHLNSAWYEALQGNPSLASGHMEAVAGGVERMGTPYYKALWNIGMAQVAHLQGHGKDAMAYVHVAQRISLAMKSNVMEWYALLVESYLLLTEGAEEEGLKALRRGLSLGRTHGYVHLEFYLPAVMRILYARALEEGIETAYVKGLIGKLELTPPTSRAIGAPPFLLEEWPYPVRIYTLGRFEMVKDDEPVGFAGKVQKKPLEMLKAIIASGGVNVPEESLTEALWPDADGDLAHKSFQMTLSRLRRLLGKDGLVRHSAGQVTLDPLSCWVDSLVLDLALSKIARSPADRAMTLVDKAVGLYKGPFLPSDTNLPWSVSRREALKGAVVKAIVTAGLEHERTGNDSRAVEFYLKGLDADHLAEALYQRLMLCYQRLGRTADAVTTYHRCRALLQANLGVGPSPETEAIYAAIIQNR